MKSFAQFSMDKENNTKFKIPAVVITHGSHASKPIKETEKKVDEE